MFEVVQAQPSEFEVGYSSARVWINGVVSTKFYFDDYASSDYLFSDINDVEIMLCSRTNSGHDVNSLVNFGNYDMMNFIWFRGAEGLYNPTIEQGIF